MVSPALYYPYIHIRSEDWLKTTLLYAPNVRRIVPEGYTPEDQPNIVKYTAILGPNGILLQSVPAYTRAAAQAQEKLLAKMWQNVDLITSRYDRRKAPVPDEYWIHDAKFSHDLLEFLTRRKLAWHSGDPHAGAYGQRTWYALHPALGSAIMTTIGLSIAREQELEIVTPSKTFHETLLTTEEDKIFDALLSHENHTPITAETRRYDLAQLVIVLGINLHALRPEDIPQLQASAHLQAFQQLIRTTAMSIPRYGHVEDYADTLKGKAEEIVNAWHKTQADLPGTLRKLFVAGLFGGSAEAIRQLLGIQFDVAKLLIEAGVGIFAYMGTQAIDHPDTAPYQYLTQLQQAENPIIRGTFPLGIA
jgi:hypothetical protein